MGSQEGREGPSGDHSEMEGWSGALLVKRSFDSTVGKCRQK